jgi:hypothetical protein
MRSLETSIDLEQERICKHCSGGVVLTMYLHMYM